VRGREERENKKQNWLSNIRGRYLKRRDKKKKVGQQ
jgi:hypothetical protein